jgi:hypothetical protein
VSTRAVKMLPALEQEAQKRQAATQFGAVVADRPRPQNGDGKASEHADRAAPADLQGPRNGGNGEAAAQAAVTTRADNLLPIDAAAVALGVNVATVRRWLRVGAPQAVRGKRGRGGAALLDLSAITAWRACRNGTSSPTAALEAFAAQMPEVLAGAIWRVFLLCQDKPLDRRTLPGALAAAWYATATALRDRIAIAAPSVPEISVTPPPIEQLMRQLMRHLSPTR